MGVRVDILHTPTPTLPPQGGGSQSVALMLPQIARILQTLPLSSAAAALTLTLSHLRGRGNFGALEFA